MFYWGLSGLIGGMFEVFSCDGGVAYCGTFWLSLVVGGAAYVIDDLMSVL